MAPPTKDLVAGGNFSATADDELIEGLLLRVCEPPL